MDELDSYQAANPYAPSQVLPYVSQPTDDEGRDGPSWEQPGPLGRRFFRTLSSCLSDRKSFFARMRPTGGFMAPVVFCVLCNAVFGVLSTLIDMVWSGDQYEQMDFLVIGIVLATSPIHIPLQIAMLAAVLHVVLVVFRSAAYPFEASWRVCAYAMGCGSPLVLIPGNFGQYASLIAILLFTASGLKRVQGASTRVAAFATLLPIVSLILLTVAAVSLLRLERFLE